MINRMHSAVKRIFRKGCSLVQVKSDQLANKHWHDYPFGRKPLADRAAYLRLAKDAQSKVYPEIDEFERQTGFAVESKWLHDLALHTQVVIKKSELCYQHGRILYSALSKYLADHPVSSHSDRLTLLETGTARGFSSLCLAKALDDQDRSGVVVTFDVLPHDTPMFWNCIDDLEGPKCRSKLLSPWSDLLRRFIFFHQGDTRIELKKIRFGRIHFAFLDGAHTYRDVWHEFSQVADYQDTGDIIVYDDYTESRFDGIVRAVDEICSLYRYQPTVIKAHGRRGYVVATKI